MSDIYLAGHDFSYQVATELLRDSNYMPPSRPLLTPPGYYSDPTITLEFLRGAHDSRHAGRKDTLHDMEQAIDMAIRDDKLPTAYLTPLQQQRFAGWIKNFNIHVYLPWWLIIIF